MNANLKLGDGQTKAARTWDDYGSLDPANDGKLTARDDKRYRNGTQRKIRLDCFRPISTGYGLVKEI